MAVCCCGVDVRPWRVRRDIGARRMVYLPASRGGCLSLQEKLVPAVMVLRSKAVWARACGQAILANIGGQKSLNSVVECTHPDADDGTELGTGEKTPSTLWPFSCRKTAYPPAPKRKGITGRN